MKKQANMTQQKEANKTPITDLKKWESMNFRQRVQNNPFKKV